MARIPSPSTVVAVLIPAGALAPAGIAGAAVRPVFRIIRTTQVDSYDKPAPPAIARASAVTMAAKGETFTGKSRKAAKISVSSAQFETFDDVKKLIASLPKDSVMINHTPKISSSPTSKRVAEEDRNVVVTAWIWAASRENDNDFHLIIGREPGKAKMFMTVEVSGLPPSNAASFARLKKVRSGFAKAVHQELPGTSYDFYQPPIKVEIGGSLFFDVSHAKGGRPGPKDLRPKMPVLWEIHPVTRFKTT